MVSFFFVTSIDQAARVTGMLVEEETKFREESRGMGMMKQQEARTEPFTAGRRAFRPTDSRQTVSTVLKPLSLPLHHSQLASH